MTGSISWCAKLATGPLLMLLAACQTPAGPVEITRFHRIAEGETLTPPSVWIAPASNVAHAAEQRVFESAVTRQLQRLGLAVDTAQAPEGNAAFRVDVRTSLDRPDPSTPDSPVSVGVGGSVGSYGSGIGVGIAINPTARRPVQTHTLSVRITRIADNEAMWEGRAVHHARAGSPAAEPGLVAPRMAEALFRGFPGRSGATIVVP